MSTDNDYNEYWNKNFLHFVIMVTSAIGTLLPLLSSKYSFIRLPPMVYFICKYFGSGVIVATAFIHLLEPAADSLGNKCLTGPITEYPWAFGICLMTLFLLFFFELLAYQGIDRKIAKESQLDNQGPHTFTFWRCIHVRKKMTKKKTSKIKMKNKLMPIHIHLILLTHRSTKIQT